MRVVEVIERRAWRNPDKDFSVSVYGAPPSGPGWSIVTEGWTWRMSNGTIGLGRPPAKTRDEAERIAAAINK